VASARRRSGAGIHPARLGRPACRPAVDRGVQNARAGAADWGPKHYGTAWPAYRQEHREWFAALVDAENPTPIVAARNRTRLAPPAIEITRMETVIAWPGRYLGADLSRVVQHVARYRALDWATEDIARKLRRSPSHLRRCNRMGLDEIARGLRTERAAIF
jgi:hypothetical protein